MSTEALEALVNGSLSDIKDLPDFLNLPVGAYRLVGNKAGIEEIGQKKEAGLKFILEVKEVMELADEEATPPKIGDKTSFVYVGEFGIQKFKKTFTHVIADLGVGSIAELLDKFEGLEFIVAIKQRKDKNDETKVYSEIQSIILG